MKLLNRVLLVLLAAAGAVRADVPSSINYQGRLLDAGGQPVNGSVPVAVTVHTAETGGSVAYTQHVGNVTVQNGIYSFSWGDGTLATALTNAECWLQVHVNGTTLAPRQRLVSVPYAVRATLADAVSPPVPSISSIAPTQAYQGYVSATVTVAGAGFRPSSRAKIGAMSLAEVDVASATSLSATVPAGLAAGVHTVQVSNGEWDWARGPAVFRVQPYPYAPGITGFSPSQLSPGYSPFVLSVAGSHFVSGVTRLRVGGQDLSPLTIASTSSLAASVPAGLASGSHGVEVSNDGATWIAAATSLVVKAWWNTSWAYRRDVTINSTVSSTLTDFPARVVVDTASLVSAGKLRADAADLRVVSGDDAQVLDYEIEAGTANRLSTVLWVRMPTLPSGNQTIRLYYGNSGASDGQNSGGTWSKYAFVYHHNDGRASKPAGLSMNVGSSVSFAYNSLFAGSRSSSHDAPSDWLANNTYVTDLLGAAVNMDQGFHFLFVETRTGGATQQTYPAQFSVGTDYVVFYVGGFDSVPDFRDTRLRSAIFGTGNVIWNYYSTLGAFTMWQGSFNKANSTLTTWVNGSNARSGSASSSLSGLQTIRYAYMGAAGPGAQWNGKFDETRIGNFVATADWAKAEYDQTWNVGSEESP